MSGAKYALVTGGNRGLGLEVCKQLVARGKPLLLTARSAAAGEKAAAELEAAAGSASVAVRVLPLDASSDESITELAKAVAAEYDQQIDLVVQNAGMLVRHAWNAEALEQTISVNAVAPVALTRALLPHLAPNALVIMVSSGLGALSNLSEDYAAAARAVSSLDGLAAAAPFDAGSPMGSAPPGAGGMAPTYSVAKALLNRATQLLAEDEGFKARGVSVAATCPGWCRTDMGGTEADRSAEQGASSILWPWANWEPGLNGSFTRDGQRLPW